MLFMYLQDSLLDVVKVLVGNKVVLQIVGVGEIFYECCVKKDMFGQFEWIFVGFDVVFKDCSGMQVGCYYGLLVIWESSDGFKVIGVQVVVVLVGIGNILYQLVKVNLVIGMGVMMQMIYIQCVVIKGGVVLVDCCDMGLVGVKQKVGYQVDYIFWKVF